MNTHGVKKCSSSNKVLAHTIKCHLEHISFKKIFGKGLRKAKNCKIPVQKRPNYIIKSNVKFGIIFLKSWTLVSKYVEKLSTKVNPHYEKIENLGITLMYIKRILLGLTPTQWSKWASQANLSSERVSHNYIFVT